MISRCNAESKGVRTPVPCRFPLATRHYNRLGITPSVQLTASPQRLARPRGAALARVVDEQHGSFEAALDVAQEAEDGGDVGDGVLVDAVQSDQGVEDQEARCDALHGLLQTAPVVGIVEAQLRANRTGEAPSPFVDDIIRAVRSDQTARNHTRDLTELAARIEAVSESYRKITEEARTADEASQIWRSPEYMNAVREHQSLVPPARRALARFTKFPGIVRNALRAGLTREVLQEWIRDYDKRRQVLRSAKSTWDPAERKSLSILQTQWNDILHVSGERDTLPIHVPGWQQALKDISTAVTDRTIPETRLPTFNSILEDQRRAFRLDRQAREVLDLIPTINTHLNSVIAAHKDPLDRSIDWTALERPIAALEEAVGALPPPAEIDPYLRHYHPEAARDLPKSASEIARTTLEKTRARYEEQLTAACAELAALLTSARSKRAHIEAVYPDFTQPFFDSFQTTVNDLAAALDRLPRTHDATRMLRENHELATEDVQRALPDMNAAIQTMDRLLNPLGRPVTRSPAGAYIPPAKDRSARRRAEEKAASTSKTDRSEKQSPSQKQDRGISL